MGSKFIHFISISILVLIVAAKFGGLWWFLGKGDVR